jgi:hypothetical protein
MRAPEWGGLRREKFAQGFNLGLENNLVRPEIFAGRKWLKVA